MKTMSELYKALSIEDSLTTMESRFYEKEEIQNFIKELKENIVLEANKIQDLNQIVFKNNNLKFFPPKSNNLLFLIHVLLLLYYDITINSSWHNLS